MLIPSVFRENLFDDFFGDGFCRPAKQCGQDRPPVNHPLTGVMRTDIKESDKGYELLIDLPGYKKEDVKAELKDGVVTVSASVNTENEEKDENGAYIRRERYQGSCSRSFFVGDDIESEDIKAKFDNGTLTLFVPKKVPEEKPELTTSISIE